MQIYVTRLALSRSKSTVYEATIEADLGVYSQKAIGIQHTLLFNIA